MSRTVGAALVLIGLALVGMPLVFLWWASTMLSVGVGRSIVALVLIAGLGLVCLGLGAWSLTRPKA